MPKLVFRVSSDYERVVKLREEIAKLKSEMQGMNSSQNTQSFAILNTQLQSNTKELQDLTQKAAQAGATLEQQFKKKIYDSAQASNDLTSKIIEQKSVVKGFEGDLRALQEEYRKLSLSGTVNKSDIANIDRMKSIIAEEKDALFKLTQEKAKASLETKKLNDEYKLFQSSSDDVIRSHKDLINTLQGMPGPLGSTVKGIKAITLAAKTFIATPLGMILGGIAAALALVTSWFKRTEEGQNALRLATAVFNQVLNSTLDVIDKVGEWIYKAFTDPEQAVKDLGNFIESQVTNRIKAIGKAGKAIVDILTGDFKKGFGELNDAYWQELTGVENLGQKISSTYKDINKKVSENMDLAKRKNALDKKDREWLVEKSKLEADIAKNREKAYDESVPEKQRAKYIKEASDLTKKMFAEEKKIAQERYDIKKKENSLSNSNKEDKMEEARLKASVIQLDAAESSAQRALLRMSNRFNKKLTTSQINSISEQSNNLLIAKTEKAKAQIRLEEDLKNKEIQSSIDLEKDSTKRKIRQRELDNKLEIQALEREKEDYIISYIKTQKELFDKEEDIKAKKDKNYKKKTFDSSSVNVDTTYYDNIIGNKKAHQNEFIELINEYQGYIDKRKAIEEKYINDKKNLIAAGASKATLDENDYQRDEALKSIDNQFAQRSEQFKSWASSVSNMALDKLKELLEQAKTELAKMEKENPNDPNLAVQRSKINTLENNIKSIKVPTPEAKSLKAWQDMYSTLQKVSGQFKQIGQEIGGVGGEILAAAGDMATSTVSMIDGIQTVAKGCTESIDAAGKVTTKTLTSMEKASIILTIISAAVQILQKISELGNGVYNQYEKYAAKLKEINALTDAVNDYRIATLKAQQSENNWFSEDNLKNLRDYKELQSAVFKAYNDKKNETQATYKNKGGGGWLTGSVNWLMGNLSMLSPLDGWKNIWGQKYNGSETTAINNLRIETQKKKSGFLGTGIGGKSQKTEDLVTWAKNNGLGDLFDDKGFIDKDLAQSLIDNYGNKLVGQTKETLEALIKLKEQYDEYVKQLHEYVSNLYEPLVDNFVDSIWDWFDNGKDALDSFKGYASDTFRDIVSDMMKTIVLDKVVGKFSDDIADIYEKYANGSIDENKLMQEVAKRTGTLIDNYEQNIPTLENVMTNVNEALKAAGIDLNNSSYSQEASSNLSSSMSQDTGNAIEGRATAIQINGENQLTQLTLANATIADIKMVNVEFRDIASDVRDCMVKSYLELVEIRENTGAIVKPIIAMQKDIATIKENTK